MLTPLSETPVDPPDKQLISLAQGGDRSALEQLVGRHGPWIFNIAARMVRRRDERVGSASRVRARTARVEAT
jgi:hypothetical protein